MCTDIVGNSVVSFGESLAARDPEHGSRCGRCRRLSFTRWPAHGSRHRQCGHLAAHYVTGGFSQIGAPSVSADICLGARGRWADLRAGRPSGQFTARAVSLTCSVPLWLSRSRPRVRSFSQRRRWNRGLRGHARSRGNGHPKRTRETCSCGHAVDSGHDHKHYNYPVPRTHFTAEPGLYCRFCRGYSSGSSGAFDRRTRGGGLRLRAFGRIPPGLIPFVS
jgi:hypothetical protein